MYTKNAELSQLTSILLSGHFPDFLKVLPLQLHMTIVVYLCVFIVEIPSTKFGEKLREQVEERLAFFETGQTPRKNIDVMKLAMDEIEVERGTGTVDE